MRLPQGRQAQPGVATGQSAFRLALGYADVFDQRLVQAKPMDT